MSLPNSNYTLAITSWRQPRRRRTDWSRARGRRSTWGHDLERTRCRRASEVRAALVKGLKTFGVRVTKADLQGKEGSKGRVRAMTAGYGGCRGDHGRKVRAASAAVAAGRDPAAP